MSETTQAEEVIRFLREHPRSTSFEIALACGISNVTSAIHKARVRARVTGMNIVCEQRDLDYRRAYRIIEGEIPETPPDWIARHPRKRSSRKHIKRPQA